MLFVDFEDLAVCAIDSYFDEIAVERCYSIWKGWLFCLPVLLITTTAKLVLLHDLEL